MKAAAIKATPIFSSENLPNFLTRIFTSRTAAKAPTRTRLSGTAAAQRWPRLDAAPFPTAGLPAAWQPDSERFVAPPGDPTRIRAALGAVTPYQRIALQPCPRLAQRGRDARLPIHLTRLRVVSPLLEVAVEVLSLFAKVREDQECENLHGHGHEHRAECSQRFIGSLLLPPKLLRRRVADSRRARLARPVSIEGVDPMDAR